MPYSNGGKMAERIWARLEDFRSEHQAIEQQRRINKQSLWYYQQCFPVPHKGTRSPFSGEDSPTMIGLLHTPGESSHLATLPLLVHGPASRCNGLSPRKAYMSVCQAFFANTGPRSYSGKYDFERFQPRNFASARLRARNLVP